jgi:hypothetical protein
VSSSSFGLICRIKAISKLRTCRSVARKTLKYAEKNGHIDHDNFLAYGVGLAFFTLGVVGMIGSDDILWFVNIPPLWSSIWSLMTEAFGYSCFVVGNAFTVGLKASSCSRTRIDIHGVD